MRLFASQRVYNMNCCFVMGPLGATMNRFVRRSLSRARLFSAAPSAAPHGHLSSSRSPITTELRFLNSVTEDRAQIPTFRVLDGTGKLMEGVQEPDVSTLPSK